MRKFLALENEELVPPQDEFPIDEEAASISLEEEQLLLDEAAADQGSVQQDLAEAERIIEVSDALEDLAVVADGIEEATPAETQLVEVVGQMAVAGTDVAPEEIVPAMESFKGKRIATEGIRETAKTIWENIRRFLAQVWEKIASFFSKLVATVPRARKRVKALKEKAQQLEKDKAVSETKAVVIRAGLLSLSVDGKVCKSHPELDSGLKDVAVACDYVYGEYLDKVAKRGEIVAKAIESFDPKNAAEAAKSLRKDLESFNYGKVPGSKKATYAVFAGFDTNVGTPLLGGLALVEKSFRDSKEESDLGALDRLRRSGVSMGESSKSAKTIKEAQVEFSTLTPAQVVGLCDSVDKILVSLEEFQKGAKKKATEKAKADVEAASNKASAKFKDVQKDEGQAAAVPFYRSMLNFNTAFAAWVKDPAMPMMSHVLMTSRAVMNVCEKSMSTYGAPKAEEKK